MSVRNSGWNGTPHATGGLKVGGMSAGTIPLMKLARKAERRTAKVELRMATRRTM